MDLLTLVVVLLVLLWATGTFIVPVGSSLIHLLLVIVVIVILVRVLRGEKL